MAGFNRSFQRRRRYQRPPETRDECCKNATHRGSWGPSGLSSGLRGGASSVLTLGLTSIPFAFPGVPHTPDAATAVEKAFFDQGLINEFIKFKNCGVRVTTMQCLECELEFYVPFHCDLRICPTCSKRLSSRFRARYIPVFKQYLRKKSKDRLMLLTLTSDNDGTMPTTAEVRAHNKAIGKLIRKFFKGGVAVNEVKDTFLHSHCVVFGPYVRKADISDLWEKLTGCRVVWISEIKGGARQVANYISKYINKPYPYDKTPEGFAKAVAFLKSFKRVRRIHSYGLFYAAGKGIEKEPFACPYCGSTLVIPDKDKNDMGWTVQDCRIRGMPSYQDVRAIWNNTTIARA